ncbi:MAG: D-inositol 3-phosphate glycosyltransferase [Chloroflexi bacterium ADurb.Bin360]|nr:MAG: D-inositol 3-phosphate glycosyltransferase [Chloroflexi bacterium ADurb.Bin360]
MSNESTPNRNWILALSDFKITPIIIIMETQGLVVLNAQLVSGAASYRSAGIHAYIVNLLRQLKFDDNLRYLALTGPGALPEGIAMPVQRTKLPTHRPLIRILWEQTRLPWELVRLRASLLHAPAFVGPLWAPCPQILTILDLGFLRHPEFFRRGNRTYLHLLTRLSAKRAAAIITISKFSAQEISALLGSAPERIHVIYPGVEARFRPLPPAEVLRFRQEQNLPERFILYLGTLEPRKNLITLIHAFARLRDPELHLVLAGGKGWLYEPLFAEVERLGLNDRVHFAGYVPAETQTLWYNAATMLAYLSSYEGFGLPVVEALACGTPVVAANSSSLPEAAGDAALLAPPHDVEAIVASMEQVLSDAALRESLRERGLRHAAHFNWQTVAQQTATIYRSLVKQ